MRIMKIAEPTLEEFRNYMIINVLKDIVTIDNKDVETAFHDFKESKTYQIIKQMGDEYDEVGPDYFFDLYKNELKYGHPVTSESLYIKKLQREGKL